MVKDVPRGEKSRHWLRPFIRFLSRRGILSREMVGKLTKFRSEIDTRIGQLASVKGYITARDVLYVVASQIDWDLPFGEAAVRMGVMSHEQVDEILLLQKDPFRLFVETLVLANVVPPDLLPKLMKDFLESSQIVLLPNSAPEAAPTGSPAAAPSPLGADLGKGNLVRARLRKVQEVATLPAMVQRVLGLVDQSEAEVKDVVGVLETDPVLCARVLRLANSAFFGTVGKIGSMSAAVVLMGFNGVRQVVLSTAILDSFKHLGDERAAEAWKHSVLTALWAKMLAQLRGLAEREGFFLAGLLHDIGKPVLAQHFPEETGKVESAVGRGAPALEAEMEVLGLTHTDVGACLCQHWSFPPPIVQAVQYHHASPQVLRSLQQRLLPFTSLVNAACRLARLPEKIEKPFDEYGLGEDFLAVHQIQWSELGSVHPRAQEEVADLAQKVW